MEKKIPYNPPVVEIVEFECEDIITTSGGACCCDDYPDQNTKPGWGWGDQNHNHSGPPGQNKKH